MTAHYQQQHRRTVTTTTTTATTTAAVPHLPPPPPPMLILVGRPGIGKSTTVTCLARELGFDTYEWTEPSSMNDNPIDSFQQFLQQCASDLTPLTPPPRRQKVGGRGETHHTRAPPKLILLEELPYTHTSDAQLRLRHVIGTHMIHQSNHPVPTILILSDTVDGPSAQSVVLERGILDATTLHEVKIMTIHAPTRVKFRHAMQRLIERVGAVVRPYYDTEEFYERCRGDVRCAITTLQWELIGDAAAVTHHHNGSGSGENRRLGRPTPPATTRTTTTMDSKLAPFHALGKLLHAKRQKNHRPTITTTTHPLSPPPPLDFCPDAVTQQTDMELPDILYFLSYHSVDFFTDINDLSTALTYFSDTSLLCDTFHGSNTGTTTMTLQNVAAAMAGRVVAHTNRHAAPSVFRSLSAPKVYDMIRKRRGNQDRIEALSHASWRMDYSRNATAQQQQLVGRISARTMAMDWLPYLKTINPHHHVSTAQWDSMFRGGGTAESHAVGTTTVGSLDVEDLEMWKEQEEILKADDIVEDIGDDDGW